MARHVWLVLLATFALVAAACAGPGATTAPTGATSTSGASTPAATSGAESPAATTSEESPAATMGEESPTATSEASPAESPGESPAESAGASASPAAAVCNATAGTPAAAGPNFDPSAISGTAELGHWQSSTAEDAALDCALEGFAQTYPNIDVNNNNLGETYVTDMINRFGSHSPPDVFYVNGDVSIDWVNQGFLLPLDDYIANSGFDMTNFYPGYQDTFKGTDGKTYGIAKDGNTIAMAYNTDLVSTPPTTMDELISAATDLKDSGAVATPMCLSPGLDRGLAFMYAQGGSLLNADNTASDIESDASKAAVQWYMDLFKNGLGAPPPTGSWCGQELGAGNVAIAFEGGWLKGFMDSSYPDTNWAFAEMPVGSIGEPVTITYTASYAIGADSANPDQGWTVLQYLTGVDGMTLWTEGGIAAPSRSDVPVPDGFEVIAKGAEYARPGAGFMPHYTDVLKAFGDAFLLEVTNQTYSADPVVTATSTAISAALGQ